MRASIADTVRVRLVGMAVVCAVLQTTSALAQPADSSGWFRFESGTAVIRGRVLAARDERPLARAEVFLTGANARRSIIANEHGVFEFIALPAGRYEVRAASAGYLTVKYGQSDAVAPPRYVEVGDGQLRAGVDVTLPDGGVIAVTVIDERGAPMEGVWVQAQQTRLFRGRLELGYSIDNGRNHSTDDRGQIRLYDLPPGDYYISAVRSGFPGGLSNRDRLRSQARLQTFYPGTVRLAEAEPVTLGPGQEVELSIAIEQTPVAQVRGHVMREDGSVLKPYGISMTPRVAGRFADLPRASVGQGDEFRFDSVLPGHYLIEYHSDPTDPRTNDFGSLEISVSGPDLTDLVLTAKPAAVLKGRVAPDTGEAPRDWRDVDFTPNITLENRWTYDLRPESDGTFAIRGLTGRGIQWGGNGYGWYLKAVTRAGKDVSDLPIDFLPGATLDGFDVVVTREHTQVTGTVRDAANKPNSEFIVVIFPEDRGRWTPASRYIATAGADEHGRFTVVGLPPGRYLAAALDSLAASEHDPALREPDSLERLTLHALPLSLRAAESVAVTLSLREP